MFGCQNTYHNTEVFLKENFDYEETSLTKFSTHFSSISRLKNFSFDKKNISLNKYIFVHLLSKIKKK